MGTWRRTVLASALLVLVALPCASATAQSATTPATSPLPASDYHVRNACRTPSPGRASCLAQELVPETAAAVKHTHPIGMTLSIPAGTSAAAAGCEPPTAKKGCYGLRPEDLRDAYFPGEAPEVKSGEPTQTIALIEAYNDLDAEADLEAYGQGFNSKLAKLTACSSPSAVEPGCFEKVNQEGSTTTTELPFPQTSVEAEEARTVCAERKEGSEPIKEWEEKESACALLEEADGWSLETSLDIEVAHATCQNCRIVLVEAENPSYEALEEAEETAAKPASSGGVGATEISNSWGGEEPTTDSAAFDHSGIVITAAAGDNGYLNWTEAEAAKTLREPYYAGADYPASSPHVVAVGGTSLSLSENPEAWQSETVWNDDHDTEEVNNGAGASGCSLQFEAPAWQRDLANWPAVGCEGRRAVDDVSADGDPYTGVAVYNSEADCEYEYEEAKKDYVVRSPWCTVGGTSVGAPLIAAMYALAGGSHKVEYPAKTLYEHLETDLLHSVSGANGECDGDYASGCTGSMSPQAPRFAFDCGDGVLICNAAADCEGEYYSGPTGVGTPNGIGAFKPEEHPAKDAKACVVQGKPEGKTTPEGGGEGGGKSSAGNTANPGSDDATAPSTATTPSPSHDATDPTPVLSGLALSKTATAALNRHHARLKVSQIAFAFTLNVLARVHITLARLTVTHGRMRWQTLPYALTITAAKGRDSTHLSGHQVLAPGRYRLTLTPAGGTARTLTFQIG